MQVDEGEKERIKVAVAVIVRLEVMIEAEVMIEIEVVILAESEARDRPLHLGRGCRPPFNCDSNGGHYFFFIVCSILVFFL